MFILFKSNFWLNSPSSVVNIPNIWKGGSGLSVPLYRLYVTLLRQLCTLGWHQASRLYSGPVCTWVKRPKTKFSKYFMKGHAGRPDLDLTTIMGWIFWPLAFCMGIPAKVFFRHHPFSLTWGETTYHLVVMLGESLINSWFCNLKQQLQLFLDQILLFCCISRHIPEGLYQDFLHCVFSYVTFLPCVF